MNRSDPELAYAFHRRARRAMLAGLEALAGAPAELRANRVEPETVHEALSVAVMRYVVMSLGRARGLFVRDEDFSKGRLFAALEARFETTVRVRRAGRSRPRLPRRKRHLSQSSGTG